MVEPANKRISIIRQCELLGIARSGIYYQKPAEKEEDAILMRLIDEQYTLTPFYGYRRMTRFLRSSGYKVNGKRVLRLMKKLGLEAIYPKPNLSKPGAEHLRFPYLLRKAAIIRANQVWATDITYIRLGAGFVYLLVIMDWHSRFVIEWELSTTLESAVFVETLKRAMEKGTPEIFNSDQGSQFTAIEWLKILQAGEVQISMDGREEDVLTIFSSKDYGAVSNMKKFI